MKKVKLVLVRHGQSEWNEKNLFTGWKNPSLTQKGIDEATAAGKELRGLDISFDVLFTSKLVRAQITGKLILKELKKPETLIEFVEDRLGHDRRYAIDSGKIKEKLGWEPLVPFKSGVNQTIKWYCNNLKWIEQINNGQYRVSE